MHRFFVLPSSIAGDTVRLEGDDVKHITRVLRLGTGDKISVCDGEGTDFLCVISQTDKDFVIADIIEKKPNKTESALDITLYQGLPKSDKLEYIIQKCTELGVKRIVPVVMKRTAVRVSAKSSRDERWKRIAEEAAKQSGRGIIPQMESIMNFEEMLDSLSEDTLCILPYENESRTKLKEVLAKSRDKNKIAIIIGPEGGFEENEVALATSKGAHCVTLGPRILRCETAPVATVSAVMYELGDW